MKSNIIGQILIYKSGSVSLEITSQAVSKKASSIDLYHERPGRCSIKSGQIRYNAYTGTSNDVTIKRSKCVQYLPITDETWSWWMKNPPSYAEMNKGGRKTRKEQIMEFIGSTEFKKATHHAADLVADLNHGRCEYGKDFTIILHKT